MVRVSACVLAAFAVAPSMAAKPALRSVHFQPRDEVSSSIPPALPGKLFGYVSSMTGLSESDCYNYYAPSSGACSLESFQQMPSPTAAPIAYGDHFIYQSAGASYYSTTFTSLSESLQNVSSRSYSLRDDCGVPLYTPTLSYGAFTMPPRPLFATDASGNGSIVPETRDLQFQVLAFNSSDNYSLPNQTYFRLYDVDMSHPTECRTKESGPEVEKQREMNLGTGNLVCVARKDEIESNVTGVIKSTHYAMIQHDMYGSTCRGTDKTGYTQSCMRFASVTSYSNGTRGTVTTKDMTDFPYDVSLDASTPCYYDAGHDAIAILGRKSSASVIIRVDGLQSYYYAPTTTIVRTLDSSVYSASGSLLNLDGNMGFIASNNLLVYSLEGDKLANRSISIIQGTYNSFTYPTYLPTNRTSPY